MGPGKQNKADERAKKEAALIVDIEAVDEAKRMLEMHLKERERLSSTLDTLQDKKHHLFVTLKKVLKREEEKKARQAAQLTMHLAHLAGPTTANTMSPSSFPLSSFSTRPPPHLNEDRFMANT